MSKVFFNNVDRSEALENFITSKSKHLHEDINLNWTISKEGSHLFKVKCICGNKVFSDTHNDPYQLITNIIGKMKVKSHKLAS